VRLRVFPAVLVLVASVAAAESAADTRRGAPESVPGAFIVKWTSEAKRVPFTRVAGRTVISAREIAPATWAYRLDERTGEATIEAIKKLEKLGEVEYAEPNFIRRPSLVPNDTNFKYQWNLRTTGLVGAWDKTTGKSSVVVAVVDSGILPSHPDLKGRLLQGYDFITDKTSAGDSDGWDPYPTDEGTGAESSSAYHGTHVAGIIGAASNNSQGIAGIDWSCKILPVRVIGVTDQSDDADIAVGIRWAAGLDVSTTSKTVAKNANPAKVINLSLGGKGASETLTKAVQAAIAAGAIVVAAGGNDASDVSDIYPAAISGVIAVGAVTLNLTRAHYSNYGAQISLMAPGGYDQEYLPSTLKCSGGNSLCMAGIISAIFMDASQTYSYAFYTGTSQAAPHVSGIASLMLSVNAKLTPSEVREILTKTANPVSKCDEGCGAGLVNAYQAVAATVRGLSAYEGYKYAFSNSCTDDAQCSDGVCRDICGTGKMCTRFCSFDTNCPSSSSCQNGFCTPASRYPTTPDPVAPDEGLTYMGGCALAQGPVSARDLLGSLAIVGALAVLAVAARFTAGRKRRRGT
jgi:serine protease